mgnify:CR=1 FL=1
MRILFVHPNYRSGGAEIAGTWPPAWVAYLTGHLRQAGFDDIHFIDAMTDELTDADLAQRPTPRDAEREQRAGQHGEHHGVEVVLCEKALGLLVMGAVPAPADGAVHDVAVHRPGHALHSGDGGKHDECVDKKHRSLVVPARVRL